MWIMESFQIKPFTEKLTELIESSKFVSIEQECQENFIQRKIHIKQNWNEGFKNS